MTSRTDSRRVSSSAPPGSSNAAPASRSCRFARTRRWAIAASEAEQRAGDLRDAEAADGLEAERDPRVPGQRRVAAQEDHPQLVVSQEAVERDRIGGQRVAGAGDLGRDLAGAAAERAVAAQGVERAVSGHAQEPRAGVVGNA